MVESNGRHYAEYLCNVFSYDPEFQQVALDWAEEELQHGVVLGKWAGLADPTFVYDDALQRFRDGFKIDLNADASVRGSRTGELLARCMVEAGTSRSAERRVGKGCVSQCNSRGSKYHTKKKK